MTGEKLSIYSSDFWSAKSKYFLQILQYETLSASSSNHEKSASYFTWTEQSIVSFSSNYMSFSARVLHLLTFLGCSLWPEPFPVTDVRPYLRKATDKQGNVTFGTSINVTRSRLSLSKCSTIIIVIGS
jgi:hypothetical protein